MALYYLTKEDFHIICSALNDFFKSTKEPPPDYRQTYFEKLDSIIAIPQKTFGGRDLYRDIYDKAACYFYFINKFHAFNNGNKRLSIVATGVFLRSNNYQLNVDEDTLYDFAKEVAHHADDQDAEFKKVREFIRKYTYTALAMRFRSILEMIQFTPSLPEWLGLRSREKKA